MEAGTAQSKKGGSGHKQAASPNMPLSSQSTETPISTSPSTSPTLSDSLNTNTYTCDRLLLIDFERCLVYSDFSALGAGTEAEIAERWDNIYSEYLTLIQDDGAIQMITKVAEMHRCDHIIARVSMLLENLCIRYNPEICDMLREEYPFHLTEETYAEDCQKISNQLRTKAMERDRVLKEIEQNETGDDGEPIDGTYFDVALERYRAIRGYYVGKRTVTVQEFCIMMRELKQQVNKQEHAGG